MNRRKKSKGKKLASSKRNTKFKPISEISSTNMDAKADDTDMSMETSVENNPPHCASATKEPDSFYKIKAKNIESDKPLAAAYIAPSVVLSVDALCGAGRQWPSTSQNTKKKSLLEWRSKRYYAAQQNSKYISWCMSRPKFNVVSAIADPGEFALMDESIETVDNDTEEIRELSNLKVVVSGRGNGNQPTPMPQDEKPSYSGYKTLQPMKPKPKQKIEILECITIKPAGTPLPKTLPPNTKKCIEKVRAENRRKASDAVNQPEFKEQQEVLKDDRQKGAECITIKPAGTPVPKTLPRCLPPDTLKCIERIRAKNLREAPGAVNQPEFKEHQEVPKDDRQEGAEAEEAAPTPPGHVLKPTVVFVHADGNVDCLQRVGTEMDQPEEPEIFYPHDFFLV